MYLLRKGIGKGSTCNNNNNNNILHKIYSCVIEGDVAIAAAGEEIKNQ